MSDSVFTKPTVIINAIAITVALAIVAGYVPFKLNPSAQIQSWFNQISLSR